MSDAKVQRVRENASLHEFASRFTTLRGKPQGEKSGPCPICGGRDRFVVYKDDRGWICRGCRPDKAGDIFDLAMLVYRCDFKQALETLDGRGCQRPASRRREPEYVAVETWSTERWQSEAKELVKRARAALTSSQDAQDYLDRRKISLATQMAYSVGFAKRAITLPWIGADEVITAVKFRCLVPFTDKKGKQVRFYQLEGGSQLFFGAHLIKPGQPTCIIEGEFNAMSAYQVLPDTYNVISPGGDTNFVPMLRLLREPCRHLLWLDNAERAKDVKARCLAQKIDLSNTVIAISPNGLDANDVLVQHGPAVLRNFLEAKINGVR